MACRRVVILGETRKEKKYHLYALAEEVPEYTPKKCPPRQLGTHTTLPQAGYGRRDTISIMWNDWREPIFSGRHGAAKSSKLLQQLLLNAQELCEPMRSRHSPYGTECREHEKLAWPLPVHEEMLQKSCSRERAPPAVDGGGCRARTAHEKEDKREGRSVDMAGALLAALLPATVG